MSKINIEISNLKKSFEHMSGSITLFKNFNLKIKEGELVALVGPSGSGKSSLLYLLALLDKPTNGKIILNNIDTNKLTNIKKDEIRRKNISIIFQDNNLLTDFTAIENVKMPLIIKSESKEIIKKKAEKILKEMKILDRSNHFPNELSGGQQQRVGIARSLAVEPDIWLLDEPFSALDPLIRKRMQDEFLRIQSKLQKSIVFITHDFQEALRLADRMAIMRDGMIVQIGRPVDLILNPVDDYVREFTTDVPWESVLCASDVCHKTSTSVRGLGRVPAATQIDSLLGYLAKNDKGVAVEAEDGSIIGIATASGVLEALANSSNVPPAQVKGTK